MRPIKLTIEGLNSFEEQQIIDFEKLTSRGFFGIFGPTGSGKSTVLDGITLALYGNMSRKSSNYINVNSNKLNVNFEFKISGTETNTYIVDREFRRTKEGIRAGKCKIVHKDSMEILAEGTKNVNSQVESVIGLNLEDFTRTVVLPQGKFSEFLKLEGKPRRDMLERLFNLEKYGDDLSRKLGRKIVQQRNEYNFLNGQLKGYEDVNEDNIRNNKEKLHNLEEDYNKKRNDYEKILEEAKEAEEIHSLQKEYLDYNHKKEELEKDKEYYRNLEINIKNSEASIQVMPYVAAYESTLESYEKNIKELYILKEKHKKILKDKNENEQIYNEIKNEKDNKLPSLIIDEQKLYNIIEEENAVKILKNEIEKLEAKKGKIQENIAEDSKVFEEKLKEVEELINKCDEKQNQYEKLEIREEFKEKVQEGVLLEQKILSLTEILNNNKIKKELIQKDNEIVLEEGKKLSSIINHTEKKIKSYEEAIKKLDKNCPGDQEKLLEYNNAVNEVKEKEKTFQSDIEKLRKSQELINELKGKISIQEKNKKSIEEKIFKEKEALKKVERENLAYKLRQDLKENEVCLVCGSKHHNLSNLVHISINDDEDKLREKIENYEKQLENISQEIIKNHSRYTFIKEEYDASNDNIKRIEKELKENPSIELMKKFEKLKTDIEEYKKQREKIQNLINETNNEKIRNEGLIRTKRELFKNNENQLDLLNKDINEKETILNTTSKELKKIENQFNVGNFNEKMQEINNIEKSRNVLEKNIRQLRNIIEKTNNIKEDIKNRLCQLKEEKIKIELILNQNLKLVQDKELFIKEKIGDKNSQEMLLMIQKHIQRINENYDKQEKEYKNLEKMFNEINEQLILSKSKDKELSVRKIDEEIKLKDMLSKNNFLSSIEVKEYFISEEQLLKYKDEFKIYNENLSKISGAIESIIKKLKGRKIEEEKYTEINETKENLEKNLNVINEEKIKYSETLKKLMERRNEQKELLEQKSKQEHRLSILNDLDKLLKGKKFIEFVAAYQLKYVSFEASKRLKEITRGNYGLEVDDNGKFIIRDYKNGGAARDASTLSGGETFLASLSLALALSAQIQLKGTAPLELFFLDEGFGTLDDELLDVVMNSLEKIHNDRLKIGIISHVESIKNRVPVKLIITPAECGAHGSMVKIEIN